LPVLEELKIKSFFFVDTSFFDGKPDNLEIFRYFRMSYFNNIDEFYDSFYKSSDLDLKDFFKKNDNEIKYHKSEDPMYSIEDIKFRLVRKNFLTKNQYEEIMFLMFNEKKFDYKDFYKKLLFQKSDLQTLNNLGHLIGLHSHNYPTMLEKLNYDEQKNEYEKCISSISNILEKPKNEIKYISHPCGGYNDDTLEILKGLGIKLGFKSKMIIEKGKKMKNLNNSSLEIPRANHSYILEMML